MKKYTNTSIPRHFGHCYASNFGKSLGKAVFYSSMAVPQWTKQGL